MENASIPEYCSFEHIQLNLATSQPISRRSKVLHVISSGDSFQLFIFKLDCSPFDVLMFISALISIIDVQSVSL